MSRRERNQQLADLLARTGWSGGELARAVNRRGRERGLSLRYDRTSVAHWLSGSVPRPPVPELVAAALTERLGHVVTPSEAGLGRGNGSGDETIVRQPADLRGALEHLVALCRQDQDPARGAGRWDTPYSWTHVPVWLPPSYPSGSSEPSSPSAPAHASAPHGVALEEMVRWFAGMLRQHGGGYLRGGLVGGVVDAAGRLLVPSGAGIGTGGGAEDHGRLVATAQLVHLLGDVTDDTRGSGLAQRYYWHALALAQAAGDSRQYAITLRVLSAQALRQGMHGYAQQLIDAGLRALGPDGDAATRSFLLAGRALVLSRRGSYGEALDHLEEATARQADAAPRTHPFAHYSLAALQYQHGSVRMAARRHDEAIVWLETSLARRPQSEHRTLALTHARLAQCHLSTGGLDAACGHWDAFLEHLPHLESAVVRSAVLTARRDLTPYGHRAQARDVLRRLPRPGRPATP